MPETNDLEPIYLITEEQIARIARARAAHNNSYAKLIGQSSALKPSELIDLYYRMKGRCAISGFPLEYHERIMHPRSIELDHIVECRRRQQLSAAISGGTSDAGMIAHIDNVQWVCRFANIMKQQAVNQGVGLVEVCRAIAVQGEAGYPLRSDAAFLGFKGRSEYRKQVILDCINNNPVCPLSLVMDKLAGTPGEASHAVVRQHMRELGWTDSRPTYIHIRNQAISSVIAAHGHVWVNQRDFQQAVKAELASRGVQKNPAVCWLKKKAREMGISLVFGASDRQQARSVCAGDKARLLSILKPMGRQGAQRCDLVALMVSNNMADTIAQITIDRLVEFGAIYIRQADGAVVASLTREQAASRIGVSVNRLKKWAASAWDGKDAGPPFMKCSSKSLTFYKHEDVDEFVANRGSHPFDLSVAGERSACVEGGRMGGRPPAAAQTIGGSSARL